MKAILRLLLFGVAWGTLSWAVAPANGQQNFGYDPGQAGGFGIPGGAESGFGVPGGATPIYGGSAVGPVNQGPIVSEWTSPTFPGILWFSLNGANKGLGFNDTYFTAGAKTRLGEDFLRGRWMMEGRVHADVDDARLFANFGLERGFTIEPAETDVYVSFWYDADGDKARNFGHTFHQTGVTGKIKNRLFDARVNGYIPVGETNYEVGSPDSIFFNNSILLQPGFDLAMRGFDAEVRVPLPNLAMFGASIDLGGYYYTNSSSFAEPFGGFRGRVNLTTLHGIDLQTEINHDDVFETTWIVRATYQFGGGAAYDRNGRDLERTIRNDHIVRLHQEPVYLVNAATGQPFNLIYVDNTVTTDGDGTFLNPFDELADAQSASSPSDIIFVKNSSAAANDTTGQDQGIVLKDNQQLLAGGVTHPLNSTQGTFNLLIDNGGQVPSIDNVNGGPAVTLASGNTSRGFNFPLTNASSAFFGDGAGGVTQLDQHTITGTDGGFRNSGIVFNNAPAGSRQVVTQTSLTQLDGRAIDIVGGTPNFTFDGGDITLNGLAVQTPLNPIRVQNTAAGSSVTIQNGLVSSTGATPVLLDGMNGTFNLFSQTTLTDSTRGLVVQNSTGTANFTELNINRAATTALGDAVFMQNNPGAAINFELLNIDNQNGGGLIATNSGTITTLGGTINTVNGPAIDIDPTVVNMTLDNVTSTDSLTSGVRLDQVSGTFNILGTLDVSGVDVVNGVTVTNSGLLDFDVANLSVTNTLGGATGGSAVNLTDNQVAGTRFDIGQMTIDTIDQDGLVINNTTGVTLNTVNIANVTSGAGVILANLEDEAGLANDVNFAGTTVIDSTDNQGIAISGVNAADNATINFADLRVSNTTGDAFSVAGGANTVNVMLGGAGITNASGRAVSITNTVGGGATFNGTAITDTGNGIAILNNTGAGSTYSFLNTVSVTSATASPTIQGAVQVSGNNGGGSVNFADLTVVSTGAGAAGIFATNNSALNITTGSVDSTNGPAINIDSTPINIMLTSATSANSTSTGVRLNGASGVFNVTGAITVSGADVVNGLQVTNSGALDFDADTVSVTNTAGGAAGQAAVSLANNAATSTFDINNMIISAVDSSGLSIDNTTAVTLGNTQISTLTGGGSGIVLNNITDNALVAPDVNFTGTTTIDTVAGLGVSVVGGAASNGTIAFNSLQISNATGTAFGVAGGLNTITANLAGTGITNTAGRSVSIANTTGGGVAFNGAAITDTGTGIAVTSNTGAGSQYLFNNTVNVNTTTTNQGAIQVTGNNGAGGQVRFADLQVTTNSATSGLFGSNNTLLTVVDGTINSTGGPAVRISNTTPGTANIALTSVTSTNSATNGVLLDNLAANSSFTTGNLVVSNPTGIGVLLNSIGQNSTFTVTGGSMTLNNANSTGFQFRHNGQTGAAQAISNYNVTLGAGANNTNVFDMIDPTVGGNPSFQYNNVAVNMADTDNSTAWLYGIAGVGPEGVGTQAIPSLNNSATNVDLGNGSFGFQDFSNNMGGGTITITTNGVLTVNDP